MTTSIADLAYKIDATSADKASASLDKMSGAAAKAETSADKLAAAGRAAANANGVVGASAQQATAQIAAEAEAMRMLNATHLKAAGSSKVLQQAGLGLSRQFADIGVSAAGGISPLMILIQQGPQIADTFAMAKTQGLGFSAVMKGLGASIAPALPLLLGIGAAVGVVVGAFALFEREVDKNTKYATTFGDTWKATLQVIGAAIMDGPIGDGLKWLQKTFAMVLDSIVGGSMSMLDRLVGFWGAAYNAITKNWRNLPQAIGAIMVAAVNGTIATIEGLINATIGGINRLTSAVGLKAIATVDLPRVKQASNAVAVQFEKDAARISASFKAGREAFGDKIAAQADKNYLARQKATKAAKEHAKATNEEADAHKKAAEEIAKYLEQVDREYATTGKTAAQVKVLDAQAMAMKAIAEGNDYAAAKILRYADAVIQTDGITKKAANSNVRFEKTIEDIGDGFKDARTQAEKLADAFDGVSNSLGSLISDFRAGNIGGIAVSLSSLGASIGTAFATGGIGGGAAAIASAAAPYVGGRAGRAITGGLGIAGAGLAAGGYLASGGLAAGVANGALALGASAGTAGALGGGIIAAGSLLGPVAIAAAAAYALSQLLKGKPTNAGAGFDLTTGALSGNKRTSETEAAALGAGQSILSGQNALKAAGATLNTTITGLVIGTRDQTQIYTSAGETLRTAIGDAGAATDAALKAVLAGAKFTNEAQQKLVDSMVAAGAGFDDILSAITSFNEQFAAAQNYSAALADQILQLTDPKAYDIKVVKDAIAEQRTAAEDAAKAGYLTADQLSTINGQLTTLEGLQLDVVLKKYADATQDATAIAKAAQDRVTEAQRTLTDAYQNQAAVLGETISKFKGFADSLGAFRKELTSGATAGLNPFQQYSRTRAEFARLSALPAGSEERLAGLQGAGSAFLAASRAVSGSGQAFNRDLALVRRAVEASETAAGQQVDAAQRQLEQLTSVVGQLVELNTNTISVAEAVNSLREALLAAPVTNGNAELLAKIDTMTTEIAAMRVEQSGQLGSIVKTNETTAKTLVRVTQDGDALLTVAA